MSIEIRNANKNELHPILDLYRHLHPDDKPSPPSRKLQRVWGDIVDDPKLQLFVAVLNEQLVASCILAIIPNLSRGARPYGLIENVVTHADHRRKGIGTRLLQHVLKIAWEHNCYKVMLLIGSKREETLRFYEKAGFRRGIKTGFIATPGDEAEPLSAP
jgi:GNAT superfamily N-acetyltransferase